MACASAGSGTEPGQALLPAPRLDVAAFRQRIAEAQSPIQHLHAQVRLVFFGAEGRFRSKAEVYVARPDHMRYTLFGPQGAPLIVLACDGEALRGLDMRARRYVIGPADAQQFDAWLSPVHLHFDARNWVRLLLGELDVPPQAVSAHNAPQGSVALSWQQADGQQIWAAFGQNDGLLRQARLCQNDVVTTRIAIEHRGAKNIPERLSIEHQRLGADGISQIELSLRDVDVDAPQKSATYSLLPPDDFAIIAPHSGPEALTH